MTLTKNQIESFAPTVYLHPDEAFGPMDPMHFIRASRFRHHRSWETDQGYNREAKQWVTGNDKANAYYDVPVSYINQFAPSNGRNRRPNDDNNGDSWNVFLQPDGHPEGDLTPNGSVPVFYDCQEIDTGLLPPAFLATTGIAAETYHKLMFWWFFGYNDGFGSFNHQGDWEHVTLKVKDGAIENVYFAAHTGGRSRSASELEWKDGRFSVYVAKGSHAAYWAPGDFHTFGSDKAAKGHRWEIRQTLCDLADQPWRDYAGAWGEVGESGTTTGPLGPWHKRGRR